MGPESIPLIALGLALVLYGVFGGADFGAGIWEVNLAFSAKRDDRRLMREALGPVWETNHVWLIFVLVVLQAAFPAALELVARLVGPALLLALVGILFRGAGFVYRVYGQPDPDAGGSWAVVFALASSAAPFFLGAALGTLTSGSPEVLRAAEAGRMSWLGWVTPLGLFAGFYAVVACAFLSAAYLAREAHLRRQDELAERWRGRSMASGFWVGALSLVGLFFLGTVAPERAEALTGEGRVLIAASALAGSGSLLATSRRRYSAAAATAGIAVAAVLLGLIVSQYPWLVPGLISVREAAAPEPVLRATSLAIGVGALLLVPSLGLLFWAFKTERALGPDEQP